MDVFEDDDESSVDSLDAVEEPLHRRIIKTIEGSLNFYRIHLLTFTLVSCATPPSCVPFFLLIMDRPVAFTRTRKTQVPFIFSGIMYACNTEYHIQYIDCLFCCVSAMTVTGLATVNLSQLSGWQQTILFLQMCMGSIVSRPSRARPYAVTRNKLTLVSPKTLLGSAPGDGVTPHDPRQTTFLPSRVQAHH
jgi:hypothetical protein